MKSNKDCASFVVNELNKINIFPKVQKIGSRSGRFVIRAAFDSEISNDFLKSLNKNLEKIEISDLKYDKELSGKYPSSKIVFEVLGAQKELWITYVSNRKSDSGGNSGPGEDELINLIQGAAQVNSRADFLIQGVQFFNISNAIKPQKTKGIKVEPKTDVLLMSGDKAHHSGAFSLKKSARLGGAPTYGGWSTGSSEMKKEIETVIDNYINFYKLEKLNNGYYEYKDNFSQIVSDSAAFYSIYGDEEISGLKLYQKKYVDHVLEVDDELKLKDLGLNCFEISGLIIHEKFDLFRGTDWEPLWLIRGANDRRSGFNDKILNKSRIAVAPAQRAKKYLSQDLSCKLREPAL